MCTSPTIIGSIVVLGTVFLCLQAVVVDEIGGRSVIVVSVPSNWFRAKKICNSYGRILLEIHNEDENIKAQGLLVKYNLDNAWIGADDLEEEDEFLWQNGEKVMKTFWASDSWDARGASQDCVAISKTPSHPQNWFDRECDTKYPFICEWQKLEDIILIK